MTKILGMDSAYDQALEAKGRPMVISPTLVVEMVDRIRALEAEIKGKCKNCSNSDDDYNGMMIY